MTARRSTRTRPTMREVAERAAVSVQTVSNYVNEHYEFMAVDTRGRVAVAMRELGYHPNVAARGLRSAETRALGFLVLDEHARFLADPLTGLVMAGVGDVARERDYAIVIQASKPSDDPDRLLTPVLRSGVDGAFLLLSGDPEVRAEHIRRTNELTDKFVVFDEPIQGSGIMSVRAADREAGRQLGRHLIKRGHRKIAFIAAAVPWAVIEQRFLGLKDALREHKIDPDPDLYAFEAGWEPATAIPIAKRLLSREDPPSAIVCSTDLLALASARTATDLKLKVPDDVAVCGFDDFPFSQFVQPALTTVRIPAYEMGREAARMLIELLNGENSDGSAEQVEFPIELLIRSST